MAFGFHKVLCAPPGLAQIVARCEPGEPIARALFDGLSRCSSEILGLFVGPAGVALVDVACRDTRNGDGWPKDFGVSGRIATAGAGEGLPCAEVSATYSLSNPRDGDGWTILASFVRLPGDGPHPTATLTVSAGNWWRQIAPVSIVSRGIAQVRIDRVREILVRSF